MITGTALPAPTAPLFTPKECGATSEFWSVVRQTDPHAIDLYRRHYSAQKSRASLSSLLSNGCVGPGETLTLLTPESDPRAGW